MSLINVSLNLTAYADEPKNVNPKVKFTDLSWSMLGLPTGIPRSVPMALQPGETNTVVLTTRAISYSTGTSFNVVASAGSNAQLQGTFGQRTGKSYGDGTSQWTITNAGQLVTLTFTGTGTAPDFTTMAVGDGVTLGSAFNVNNQGDFVVVNVNVGGTAIEFLNPIVQPETVTGLVQVYSAGPVQVGDILDISDSHFLFSNQGQFKILRVTDTFIEFSNPNLIPQSGVTGVVANGVVVYPEAHTWILMAIDHKVVVRLNGDTGNGVIVEPPVDGDLVNYPGLLLKRGKIFQVTVYNPTMSVASGQIFLAG